MMIGVRPDVAFGRLRAARRRRLMDAMAAEEIDGLILGRPAHVALASGARQLWTAGARPFGPAAVVVAATQRVHVLSTWDEGVPAEVGHEDLYGLSWNPAVIADRLRAIPGLSGSARVGTDGYSPGAAQLFAGVWPAAVVTDAEPVLARARNPKSADEVACIGVAAAIAEGALSDLVAALRPGLTERQLVGVFAAGVASRGSPTMPSESVVMATPRSGPIVRRGLISERQVGVGELVALHPGAFSGGYEGGLARTVVAGGAGPDPGQRSLLSQTVDSLRAVIDACRPGARGAEVLAAGGDATVTVHGVGLGAEPPVVAPGVGSSAVVETGSVLAVSVWRAAEGAGGVLFADLVHVTERGPEVLTRYPYE
jgi:Xaa-Pro aminopeptidase